jgi:hypothetical protein
MYYFVVIDRIWIFFMFITKIIIFYVIYNLKSISFILKYILFFIKRSLLKFAHDQITSKISWPTATKLSFYSQKKNI